MNIGAATVLSTSCLGVSRWRGSLVWWRGAVQGPSAWGQPALPFSSYVIGWALQMGLP